MIELAMVRRMLKRGLIAAPAIVASLWLAGGQRWALSALVGLAISLLNLWLAGRIIGGIAENRPELLVAAGFAAFAVGLVLVTVAGLVLTRVEELDFTVIGLTLVGVHLVLVTWEAADAFLRIDGSHNEVPVPPRGTRS